MDYKTAMCLPRMCEYMFRKGLYDASLVGDPEVIEAFTKRNTSYHKPDFIADFNGKILRKRQYLDYLQMVCSTIEAPSLRDYIAYKTGADKMKVYIIIIANYYYREGMNSFDGETAYITKDSLDNIGKAQVHIRKGKRRTVLHIFDEMKYKLVDIEYTSESGEVGLKTSLLARAMGNAVLKHKMRSCE